MLEQFIRKQEAGFAMLQEVTSKQHIEVNGYYVIDNIGTAGRGTALLIREELQVDRIKRIPSGRGVAVYYNNICLIKLYAPSGTTNRSEREAFFFNSEVLDILPTTPNEIIMAGDCNCVQADRDCTGRRNSSKRLDKLIRGLQLVDVWNVTMNDRAYTHYTPMSAARLDRIYATENIRKDKQGVETIAAAFTDHLAVLLRVKLSVPLIQRGRGRWTVNTSFWEEKHFKDKLNAEWAEWKKHIPRFPSIVQ